jgi:hypothetical protein
MSVQDFLAISTWLAQSGGSKSINSSNINSSFDRPTSLLQSGYFSMNLTMLRVNVLGIVLIKVRARPQNSSVPHNNRTMAKLTF